jgi:hypothetical protein
MKNPADVDLTFCEERVCGIQLHLRPAADMLGRTIKGTYDELRKRYGKPRSAINTTSQCKTGLAQCIAEGQGKLEVRWAWPDRHRVMLNTNGEPLGAHLIVTYLGPSAGDPAPSAGPAF